MKRSPEAKRSPDYRWLVGAAIGVAVVVLIGLKVVTSESPAPSTSATAGAQPITLSPPGQASTARQPAPAQPSPPSTTPAAARAAEGSDPFPANPVAQIEWATRNRKPAMILFHSTNCIPCKAMEALVKKVRGDYEPRLVFIDVITNDAANSVLVRQAGIQAIPTTFLMNRSGQSKRVVGAVKEQVLRAELAKLLEGG